MISVCQAGYSRLDTATALSRELLDMDKKDVAEAEFWLMQLGLYISF